MRFWLETNKDSPWDIWISKLLFIILLVVWSEEQRLLFWGLLVSKRFPHEDWFHFDCRSSWCIGIDFWFVLKRVLSSSQFRGRREIRLCFWWFLWGRGCQWVGRSLMGLALGIFRGFRLWIFLIGFFVGWIRLVKGFIGVAIVE